jgi:phosphate transport system permease protein
MKVYERIVQFALFISAIIAILGVVFISYFIISEGYPVIQKVGIVKFIMGMNWSPIRGIYGIYPMIIGSLAVTAGALIIGVPVGIGCAVFLAELAKPKIAAFIRPWIELLGGIPSVIFGLFGLTVIVPFLRKVFNNQGFSVLAGSVVLAVMILPTIVNVSESAIKSIPKDYKEASLSLGSSHWQAIRKVIVPAARSGIITSVILGMGRAIGETMAVIMIVGNSPIVPDSILSPVRTLTGNIGIEMGYAGGEHQQALFATGIVLFVFIMLLNIAANLIPKKVGD